MSVVDRPVVERKLEELGLQLSPKVVYRLETVFPFRKGKLSNGTVRTRVKLAQALEPLLQEMLFDQEVVQFFCNGKQSASSRTWILGFLGEENIKLRVVLVLTNLRVLCILMESGGRAPARTFWSIYYSQIDRMKTSFTDEVKLELTDGQTLSYYEFSREEILALKRVMLEMTARFEESGFDPPVQQSWERLCGNCYHVVPSKEYECEHCRALFWQPGEIALRSFVFPPWGTYVLGHYGVALWEMLVFCLLLVYDIAVIRNGDFSGPLLLLLIGNVFAALYTSQSATKGLYLKEGVEKRV